MSIAPVKQGECQLRKTNLREDRQQFIRQDVLKSMLFPDSGYYK